MAGQCEHLHAWPCSNLPTERKKSVELLFAKERIVGKIHGDSPMARTPMGFRQIHLDFHTSPHILDVAKDFDPQKFARTMKDANVDSVTVFAKGHHGHMFIKTDHPSRHPGLAKNLDLTKEQVKALKAEGIRAPIYISVMVDEFAADTNPGWVAVCGNGAAVKWGAPFMAGWQILDMSSPYMTYLQGQVQEIMENFDPGEMDGVFFDMCWNQPTASVWAKQAMLAANLDPACEADRNIYAGEVSQRYMKTLSEQVRRVHPKAGVFFNGRPLSSLPRDLDHMTHVEIEGLPTGGWGYMFFPVNVRYVRTFDVPYMGMTGRFHKSWGDFGGVKPEPALKYEIGLFLAHGARCSIGDQLHPRGVPDKAVYETIGRVYGHAKACQPWCEDATPQADTVVLSRMSTDNSSISGTREGFTRMFQQLRGQFNVIEPETDFAKYKLVVVPEQTRIDAKLAKRLDAFVAKGGAVLIAGTSGLSPVKGKSPATDKPGMYEVTWKGLPIAGPVSDSPFSVTYFRAMTDLSGVPDTDNVLYERGLRVKPAAGAKVLARVVEPYFDRAWNHFCSHGQTPPDKLTPFAAAIVKGKVAYIPFPVFSMFGQHAVPAYRALVAACVREIMDRPMVEASGPTGLEISVMTKGNMTVVHLLYATAERRCPSLDLVEDAIPLHNVKVSLAAKRKPNRVYLAPSRKSLDYTYIYANDRVEFTVPTVEMHQMVVLE